MLRRSRSPCSSPLFPLPLRPVEAPTALEVSEVDSSIISAGGVTPANLPHVLRNSRRASLSLISGVMATSLRCAIKPPPIQLLDEIEIASIHKIERLVVHKSSVTVVVLHRAHHFYLPADCGQLDPRVSCRIRDRAGERGRVEQLAEVASDTPNRRLPEVARAWLVVLGIQLRGEGSDPGVRQAKADCF